ncbi:MAG: hypothetical protein RLZZ399_2422 [Verrucomicrobiota bacterium]|jgi:hypothetical protein
MEPKELDAAIDDYLEECLSEADAARLSGLLVESPEARKRFWEMAAIHAQLEPALQQRSIQFVTGSEAPGSRESFWSRYPTAWAAAACVVMTLLSTTIALAIVSPRANQSILRRVSLGEAEMGKLRGGFPLQFGVWSGDIAAVEGSPQEQDAPRTFRFIRAEADEAAPNPQPNSCDVFQIVDLRSAGLHVRSPDDILELSARFCDERPEVGERVRFVCRLILYEGDFRKVAKEWPLSKAAASALGTGDAISEGGAPGQWHVVTARSTIPAKVDFAVLQVLVTKPPVAGRSAEFGSQLVSDIRLTLRGSAVSANRPSAEEKRSRL